MAFCAAGAFADELAATARAIGAPGKGILAADESTGTIGKRFAPINVENIEENRRAYRELLFTAPGIESAISGVILFEETLYQKTADGTPFVDILKRRGIIPGIKVDKGVSDLPGCPGETTTEGLDGLNARCKKYYEAGARFAKWRAVLRISDTCPTQRAITENAHGLARYAAVCQANGLAPIVEPEILSDGSHSLQRCQEVTERVVQACTEALAKQGILFEGMMLKPNMVTAGADVPRATPVEVGRATVRALSRSLPAAVPTVCFLSGGQSEEEATVNLNAMNQVTDISKPWSLTFSYGRALQASVLKAWKGDKANVAAAQAELLKRASANGQAQLGKYGGGAAGAAGSESLYVKNYSY